MDTNLTCHTEHYPHLETSDRKLVKVVHFTTKYLMKIGCTTILYVSCVLKFQVEKAEAILKQIKSCLTSSDMAKLPKLLTDYYAALPHKPDCRVTSPSVRWLSQEQDICQVILKGKHSHLLVCLFFFL